ncbi:MAG: PepSY-associated TM helix domain-containing protein [Pseudomonadota bacterium]
MTWRRPLIILHRDLGYFVFGLTVVYAVSGIATNHRAHWDYNHSVEVRALPLGDPAALLGEWGDTAGPDPATAQRSLARERQADLVQAIGRALERPQPPRKVFWRNPDRLSLFYAEGELDVVDYIPSTGVAEWTQRTPRPLIRQFNMLHLNEKRWLWTWVGDGYALVLLFMALSGVLIVKGRKGLRGRGGMFLVAGILLPTLVILFA